MGRTLPYIPLSYQHRDVSEERDSPTFLEKRSTERRGQTHRLSMWSEAEIQWLTSNIFGNTLQMIMRSAGGNCEWGQSCVGMNTLKAKEGLYWWKRPLRREMSLRTHHRNNGGTESHKKKGIRGRSGYPLRNWMLTGPIRNAKNSSLPHSVHGSHLTSF